MTILRLAGCHPPTLQPRHEGGGFRIQRLLLGELGLCLIIPPLAGQHQAQLAMHPWPHLLLSGRCIADDLAQCPLLPDPVIVTVIPGVNRVRIVAPVIQRLRPAGTRCQP